MTTPAPVSLTPLSIDYTNRDFYSLREAMIARVQNRIPDWSGSDPSDFGLAMIEAFSYLGDILGYYADRVANETNILTATQRSSVLALARNYGYTASGYQSAKASVQLYNSSASAITVPAGTQFSTSVTIGDAVKTLIFTTDSDVSVPAKVGTASGTASVTAFHGEDISQRTTPSSLYSTSGELLGYSNGAPVQSFVLKENQVVDGSLTLYVKSGSTYAAWKSVSHLSDYGPTDAVFRSETDDNNYVTVVFGDGISGAIPQMHSEIRAKYVVGGGISGNIPARTPLTFRMAPAGTTTETSQAIAGGITADSGSAAASGGVDPESTDSIRSSATKAFATLGRAVTTNDYASLAVGATGCSKANAVADVWSSVTLYVAPTRDANSTDVYPLFDVNDTTYQMSTLNLSAWNDLKTAVASALADKTQVGVSVSLAPPKYVPVNVEVRYTMYPGFTDDQVQADIKNYMQTVYNYVYRSFAETVRPEHIELLLQQVAGVENVRVTKLFRVGETPTRSTLVGSASEIFVFNSVDSSNVSRTVVQPYSSVSSLSALTIAQSGGTVVSVLSPTFTSAFYNYVYAVSSAATSVAITPTATSSASVITVNGTTVASGVASGAITLGAAGTTTTAVVTVTAEDAVTTSTYRIAISRSA